MKKLDSLQSALIIAQDVTVQPQYEGSVTWFKQMSKLMDILGEV